MLKHNLRLIFRKFKKDKSTFSINLIGLTVGLVVAISIFGWVINELSYDKFHVKSDNIYRVINERFQNGDAKFFIGNPQTGGYGLTLTSAQNVIYFSNSFDLAVRMQSEDRAHRIGQRNTVTYIDLISEGTIDEKIVKALRGKMDIASQVMGENFKEWVL